MLCVSAITKPLLDLTTAKLNKLVSLQTHTQYDVTKCMKDVRYTELYELTSYVDHGDCVMRLLVNIRTYIICESYTKQC